ncbi:MAG TPA: PIN domain-containing protein [Vicinamibacteria bacterium]|nr:PIN domain-containing protein [Vicinamibacteria bacterium]
MWLVLFRVVLVSLLAHAGYVYTPFPGRPGFGLALGVLVAAGIITLEMMLRSVPGHHMVGALVGGVTGLVGARLVWGALSGLDIIGDHFLHVLVVVFLGYMGIMIGGQKGEWFEPARIIAAFRDSSRLHQYKILDTSVIIDGRIADICETGFVEGTLVVPQFVLRELQQVADSSDSLKRNRGRRGLDILQKIQKMANVHVQIVETDFPETREVDLKLIELARRMNGKIVTNDFNLNKVAQLRGVQVLNINELANSLKPVVLPGEVMRVFVIKEGKEAGQGVAYLDDGTMVVVDQAKKALGRTIEVSVTSVLQTTAGKMIFCRWIDAPPAEEAARSLRLGDRRDPRNGRDYRLPDRRETDRRTLEERAGNGGDHRPAPATPTLGSHGAAIAPIPPAVEHREHEARHPELGTAPMPGEGGAAGHPGHTAKAD